MSSNFNNAKIINVYYNKGDRKPYDVNGKPIAYIGEEAIGATEATTIRFYLGEDLDSSTAVIVTKRPDGERRLDLCEKFGTGVNSYYQVTLNAWYGAVKGKATLAFKVYNGEVEFDDEETPTEIISVEGRIVVSDIFNLEIAYAPEADLIVPSDDTPDYVEWFAALSTKLDKAQSITVTGALPTLTGDVYDDRYFYVENEGTGRLYYINGSTAIEVVWQVGTLRLTPTGNGEVTADTAKLSWNQPNGTVNVGLYNDVNIGVGEDVIYYVKATGAITKGDVIQYAGFQGDHALAKRAVQSEINANPKLIMGIAKQNIANGEFGYVAHFGKLEDVDTKSQAVNSFVWFDSAGSTAGNWTTTQPTAPNAKILLAVIIKAESSGPANNGVLLVRPTIEPKVSELQDINITSIANNQVLRWNATNSRWENTGALTTAETNITNIQNGTTIVGRANADKDNNEFDATYLKKTTASATYIPLSQKAQANGVATLGTDGRIPASQIPGVVTSIEEYDTLEDFPEVGVLTTVYLALDTGLTYLWSGSQYVALSSSLALGETSTTAYRGDRGKIAYDYSQVGHLPLAGGTITNDLTVGGNLTVSGTTTTVNTQEINIKDNLILINSNQTDIPSSALKGGLEIERGDLTNFQFVFDESDDRFKVGQVGSLQTVATRTDDGTIANRGITFFNTSTNRLENNANIVVNTDNNVGIGTASPTYKLDVTGNLRTTGGIDNESSVAGNSHIGLDGGSGAFLNILTTTSTGNTIFRTFIAPSDYVERMRITGGGNVGIGTTSPTTAKLEVANSSNAETSIRIFTSGVHSTYIGNKASDTNLYISNTTSGGSLGDATKSITLGSAGNAGIGTTNPSILGFGREFSVSANGLGLPTSYINVQGSRTDDNDVGGLVFHNIVSGTNVVVSSIGSQRSGANNSGNLIFYTSNAGTNSERMRIASNGNITISGTILQEAFIAPTLLNSWVNFGSGYQEVGYMKDSMGFVHIRGMIKSGTLGADIFILPAGYRPNSHILQVGSRDVGGTEDAANFQILSDGRVMATTGSTSWTSFGNISFKAG
jgi:hypothetical protein